MSEDRRRSIDDIPYVDDEEQKEIEEELEDLDLDDEEFIDADELFEEIERELSEEWDREWDELLEED